MLLALGLFVAVLVATALEWTHLCLAALLGAAAMLLLGVLTPLQAAQSLGSGGGTIALLFGMMLVVRALEASGAFNGLAHRLVELSGGQGRRLLLGLVLITMPVAALLPNPSAVLLIAPLMPPLARELQLDFRPLLILMVLAANSASLLTLVGDPAPYIIGTGMHWDFARYLRELGPAALLVLLTLVSTLPWLYRPLWRAQLPVTDLRPAPAHHRGALPWLLLVALLMLVLFITGSSLPVPLDPAAVALGGAVATLFISHHSGLKPVDDLLASIDWATLLYFAAVFVLVGGPGAQRCPRCPGDPAGPARGGERADQQPVAAAGECRPLGPDPQHPLGGGLDAAAAGGLRSQRADGGRGDSAAGRPSPLRSPDAGGGDRRQRHGDRLLLQPRSGRGGPATRVAAGLPHLAVLRPADCGAAAGGGLAVVLAEQPLNRISASAGLYGN